MHALANISGETRSESEVILTGDAEENLRCLIYEMASRTSKLTPSVSQTWIRPLTDIVLGSYFVAAVE